MLSQPILFIAREMVLGGAASMAARLITRLAGHYEIDLLVAGPSDERMLGRLPGSVNVFHLQMGYPEEAAYSLGEKDSLGALELVLRRQGVAPLERSYHAVLATSVFPNWRAALAVSLVQSPRKIVFLVDEALAFFHRMPPRERSAVESCFLAADLVLPVSAKLHEKMASACPALAGKPWEVFYPPIEDPPVDLRPVATPVSRDLPLVMTMARLVPDKGILENVRAHARLRDAGFDFRWIVVGEGPQEAEIRREIEKLGLGDRFLLVGYQERTYEWLSLCDFFVLLSKSEGGPTVVREAIRIGKPVVMTRMNGDDEMVEDGRTGFIVPDEPAAIDGAMAKLLGDPALLESFRRRIAEKPRTDGAAEETARLIRMIEKPIPAEAVPDVSILIPTYNQADFLDQAISSALMQNFPSLEVVVVDDASTDRTPQTAAKWKADPRFRYVRNRQNLGLAANYRKAIAECARGTWALMLDGDDYLTDPAFITKAKEAIGRQAGRKIVFAQAGHRVHDRGGRKPDVDILPAIEGMEARLSGGEYLRFVFETGFFSHLGILFDREEAVRRDCYRLDIASSDMDSFLRLATEGEVLLLRTLAGCWVHHDSNASSNRRLDQIAANVRIFRSVAQAAIEKGLASKSELSGPLSRYEAQTLAFLFNQSLARSGDPGFPWLKIWSVALSVNPRLIVSLRFIALYLRLVRKFLKRRLMAFFKRTPPS